MKDAKRAVAALIPCLASVAHAQSQVNDCLSMHDMALRLACYDSLAGYKPPEEKTEKAQGGQSAVADFISGLYLRDQISPGGIAGREAADPAVFGLSRVNGEEASAIRAALTWRPVFSPFSGLLGLYGWGPLAGVSINRNTLTGKFVDTRIVSLGVAGNVYSFERDAFSLLTGLRFFFQDDRKEDITSRGVVFEQTMVAKALSWGSRYNPNEYGLFVLPRWGLHVQDRTQVKAGEVEGITKSGFVGVKVLFYPGPLSARISLSATAQRFVDFSAPAGLARRHDNFYKVSIDYSLYPRGGVDSGFVPAIALERTVGADPLTGTPRTGITQLVLKLKFN